MSVSIRLFLGNLPYDASEEDVKEAFAPVVGVSKVEIPRHIETNRGRGFGFLDVMSEEDAAVAMRSVGQIVVGNRQVRIEIAKPAR